MMKVPFPISSLEFENYLKSAKDGDTIYLESGTYELNNPLELIFEKGIKIIGEKGTIIDARNISSDYALKIGGKRLESSPIKSKLTKTSKDINCELSTKVGDIYLVRSDELWNPSRAYYRKGEIIEIEENNGSSVRLKAPLIDDYSETNTTLIKLQMPSIEISNINIICNSNILGLKIEYAKDIYLSNINITGARISSLSISYVFNGTLSNITTEDNYYIGTGTSYGLVIVSSQSINIVGGKYTGGRHGIAHGGNEPCRHISISGATITNYLNSGQAALDAHGNTEYLSVDNCTILNGVALSSINTNVTNCKITSINVPGILWYGEVGKNGYLNFTNNSIESQNGLGVYITAAASDIRLSMINIKNNVINSYSSSIRISYYNSSVINFSIGLMTIDSVNLIAGSDYGLLILPSTDRILIDKCIITSSRFTSNMRAMYINLKDSSDLTLRDSVFESLKPSDYGAIILRCNDLIVDGCNFKGTRSLFNIMQCIGTLRFINNSTIGFTKNGGVKFTSGEILSERNQASELLLLGNVNRSSGTFDYGSIRLM